jgi:hypothetical protein
MLEKAIAWSPTPEETISRMLRARVPHPGRGNQPRVPWSSSLHPSFAPMKPTRFIDEAPDSLHWSADFKSY